MEDNRKPFSNSESELKHTASEASNVQQQAEQEQAASKQGDAQQGHSSYYYAYGPYQSVNSEDTASTTSRDAYGASSDVQVTPPNPVKPLPFSSATRQTFNQYGSGTDASSAGPGTAPPGNWNFNNQKPQRKGTSFKAMFASFMAGMIVITSLMYAADRTNLFTGEAASHNNNSGEAAQTVVNNTPTPFPNGASSVAEVAKSASPAVVKIETYASARRGGGVGSSNPWMDDPFFKQFFGDNYGGNGGNGGNNSSEGTAPKSELQPLGIGTGFIFDKSGYILTNNHVVEGGEMVQVTVEGYEKPLEAEVLGKSQDLDLAVLKIKGEDFPTLKLGNSDAAQVGEQMVAIGNPSGFDHTVTTGVLSAKERSINIDDNGTTRQYEHLLQTDASINPGNSGGPLLNMKGEVIGMNVAVSKQAQGIGFAIPSNVINKVVENLKANKEIPKEPSPFIGATLMTMTDEIAKKIGIESMDGALVANVLYGSPAYKGDLRAYDVITGIEGKAVTNKEGLIEAIQKKKVGDVVSFQVYRDGKKMDVKVTIGDKNKFENIEQP
ncbi:trypsin-like peptidase domain-containing protein [Paenibacillus sp. UMB4589-SE434]|uniref:S1C family serine protease n=1 Tax=Paenibacillus sp. UMB4589-SE434 TaxID=3046314 RepID=UPI00254A5A76|nr:trypsin-like peptidase domain-containing protein [Paenibacillus sp. UMB4589-SE434]MDK8183116.1 trypsin-like peptidase domain-containing protein [Paenibacillus sp. UMB4589-SE434]